MDTPHTLDDYVAVWAEKTPETEAFRFNGRALTFRALAEKAGHLSRWLNGRSIGPGERVGIYMEKGLDMPVAVFGVLGSGAAYVPLDPAAPLSRTAELIEDCGISVVISQDRQVASLRGICAMTRLVTCIVGVSELGVAGVECIQSDIRVISTTAPPERRETDPAYIIFTSGSTGVPKGIVHTHASAMAYAEMAAETYGLVPGDRMGNHAPLHFDMSTFEFFAGISRGATVVMVPEILTKLPASLSQLIADERLSVWYSVPFALIQLVEYGALDARDISTLRWVIFAGAPMSPKHLQLLQDRLPHAQFSNAYGPAEVNVVTYHNISGGSGDGEAAVPIGTACPHADILLADDGELLVATPASMQGYWLQPALTEAAFEMRDGKRYYRTGDLVVRDDTGLLHYLGRKDRQVKIRGFRVELDEVELVLGQHETVSEAAALVAPDGLTVEGFVSPAPGACVTDDAVLAHCRNRLQGAAVPSRITVCGSFPRTSTGKIDRKNLRKSV